jgi:hypothetical protein
MNNLPLYAIALLLSASLIQSCGNTSEGSEEPMEKSIDQNSRYGINAYDFPQLSPAARRQMDEWTIFSDFEDEAKKINNVTLGNLKIAADRLLTHTDSLASKFPDTLNTLPISTRLTLVKTRSHLLLQELERDRVDSVRIQEGIAALNQAVANFIERLNEEFKKNSIDLQLKENERIELEKQQRFRDSVFKAELEDQGS